ncbi:MAG TPA: HDIG domain-containing protein [Gemmatimonadetes bacterium]|nr:HDIG domain-containing protein [Gemmatimonadota bacterium]
MSELNETSSMFRSLSGKPGDSRGKRFLHHGSRVLLLITLTVLVTALFPPSGSDDSLPFEDWGVAPDDVIAEVAFSVPKSASELDIERQLAMEAVPRTFDVDPNAADTMVVRLDRFFEELDSAATASDRVRFEEILQASSIIATPAQVDYIMGDTARNAFRSSASRAAREIIADGVVEAGRVANLTTTRVTIRENDSVERTAQITEVLTTRDFLNEAALLLPPGTPPSALDLLNLVLLHHIEYSYVLNVVATEMDRDAAARSVETVKQDFLEGQAIARQGDPIGPEVREHLRAYEVERRNRGLIQGQELAVGAVFGTGLINLMLLGLFGLLVFFNRPKVYATFHWLMLIALLVTAYFFAAAAISRAELLPIAFVALPVAVLWDTRMSLSLVLVIAAITGRLEPFASYDTFLLIAAGGSAAAFSVRVLRRRSDWWVSIAIIASVAGLMLISLGLVTSRPMPDVAWDALFAGSNAAVSVLLAMGCLSVFEWFTGITTDQTLLEWADPTRPLLRRLSSEAPGTYAHTINVANLSEGAATAIGANGLLSRVGAYYHDVGKMLKPHYFVENQPEGRNPHDKLKASTSAEIVREHVTEGVQLAREAKVPEVISQFILEHHGTQRIGFFFEKAREEMGGEIDSERFSYPGPKPRSKEAAIVMLADSCESATRAMQEPTVRRLQDLIDTVVDGKIADRQLEEAPLTLREVADVKAEFVKILSGVMHRRIEYPATRHLTDTTDDKDEPSTLDGPAEGESPAEGSSG